MLYLAIIYGIILAAILGLFLVRFFRDHITDEVVIYLPKILFFLGLIFYLVSCYLSVHGLLNSDWMMFLCSIPVTLIGVAAFMCQLNQRVTMISKSKFMNRTFLGNEKEYKFSDFEDIRFNTDSMTIIMKNGKIHVESIAVKKVAFFDQLEAQRQDRS